MSSNADMYDVPGPRAGRLATSDPARRPVPTNDQDGSQAAARLLEKTARETDQWIADARNDSAAIVASAREESAALVRAAREEADRLVAAAKDEAARLANDARAEAYRLRESMEATRQSHDQEIARLQQVEADHRTRLRHHLTAMLDQVQAAPGETTS